MAAVLGSSPKVPGYKFRSLGWRFRPLWEPLLCRICWGTRTTSLSLFLYLYPSALPSFSFSFIPSPFPPSSPLPSSLSALSVLCLSVLSFSLPLSSCQGKAESGMLARLWNAQEPSATVRVCCGGKGQSMVCGRHQTPVSRGLPIYSNRAPCSQLRETGQCHPLSFPGSME